MSELGLNGKLIAADMTEASPAYHAVDMGVLVPTTGRIEYIPALLKLVEEHDISLVVPLTDLDLRSLARQRQRFEKIGCTVATGSEHAVTLCRDKSRINSMLGKAGLAMIETHTLEEFLKKPFYPCFIKPIRGSASLGTGMLRNEKELKAHVATYGDVMLVQEYVPGREYTIDVFRTRSGQVKCVVPRQRLQVRSGEVEKGITVKNDTLIDATLQLTSCMGDLWGVFCCQCRWMENGPLRFFEINPRFGGGVPLSIAAGANFPLYLLQETLNLPVTAKLRQFTDNLLMLRYDQAFFVPAPAPDKLPGFNAPMFR